MRWSKGARNGNSDHQRSDVPQRVPNYGKLVEGDGPSDQAWHQNLDRHFQTHVGPCPQPMGEVVSGTVAITLYDHVPTESRPWRTLRTAGVSDYPMSVPKGFDAHRYVELMVYLPADWDLWGLDVAEGHWWPARLLKQLGNFVHDQSTWFGGGHTVRLAEPGQTLGDATLFTTALLLPPWPEVPTFDQFQLDRIPCRFLWVVPITEDEENFSLDKGAQALVALMRKANVSHVIDPSRSCLVTGKAPR